MSFIEPINKEFYLILAGIVALLDQISKYCVTNAIGLHESVRLLPFLNFTSARNEGIAFSYFDYGTNYNRWMLIAVTFVICIFLLGWLFRLNTTQKLTAIALALIIGGAAGNFVDRLVFGYVRDFVDFFIGQWHFAIFNLADSAISIGACLLIIDVLKQQPAGASK